jgi:hypothetical protein
MAQGSVQSGVPSFRKKRLKGALKSSESGFPGMREDFLKIIDEKIPGLLKKKLPNNLKFRILFKRPFHAGGTL